MWSTSCVISLNSLLTLLFVLTCRSVEGAEDEKAPSAGAKSLCIPHDQARWGEVKGKKCPQCGSDAKRWTLFGRSCESGVPFSANRRSKLLINWILNRLSYQPEEKKGFCLRGKHGWFLVCLSQRARYHSYASTLLRNLVCERSFAKDQLHLLDVRSQRFTATDARVKIMYKGLGEVASAILNQVLLRLYCDY